MRGQTATLDRRSILAGASTMLMSGALPVKSAAPVSQETDRKTGKHA
jgi:hypothetical protein